MVDDSAEHQDLVFWKSEAIHPSRRSLGRAVGDSAEVLVTRPSDTPSG